ncbi:hypothetical protein B296_00048815 [Ensete ventricosum]|uniref:Uncharacterized protein n=1 Tax=Ensete ventricosum TaxID=4639 RepID=A0A426X4U9_ENSVE|nr:hypothetical protein B296_00048815 [Ensete ventricosum]
MLSYDSEKSEGVCHEPEPLLVLMGWAAAATRKVTVWQGSTRVVDEEDGDESDSDVSKAFTVTLLSQPAAASVMEPNTLMLFEEAGGDLSQANFQTVTVGNVCANADEGETMGEGAPSTWLGSWKQWRWWRKGSGRGWHELRRWQQSFHCCARYNRVDDGSNR